MDANERAKAGRGLAWKGRPEPSRFEPLQTGEVAGTPESIRLRVVHPEVIDTTERVGLTWGTLFTLDGKRAGTARVPQGRLSKRPLVDRSKPRKRRDFFPLLLFASFCGKHGA